MSDNRYRPGATRRDSDRSPGFSNDSYFDRPSVSSSRRDSDRVSDYATDRYRSSRSAPWAGESFSESRRSVSDTQLRSNSRDTSVTANATANANANIDLDRGKGVQSDIAKQLKLLHEAQFDLGKWTSKKDFVLEGFRQRVATYERHGGRNAHEPAVVEAWRKHQDHFKQEEDKFDKELVKINERIKESADNYARLLVQSFPEIKERHLIDAVTAKLAKDSTPAHSSLMDDRTQKLEKQMTVLLELQKAQEASCAKLVKENEEQRKRITSYEAQAIDIAALKAQQKILQSQLQAQHNNVNSKAPHHNEIETLKQEKEALKSQLSAFQIQLANLVNRIDSQQADFTQSLQEATTQLHASTTVPPGSLEQVTAVEMQIQALRSQVQEHDKVFSNIDVEEYTEAVSKLMKYPDYPEWKRTIDGQEGELKRLRQQLHSLNGDVTSVKLEAGKTSKRLATTENRLELGFKEFSDQVIETCGKAIQGLKDKIENLHTHPEAPAEELKSLRDDHNRVEKALSLLRDEVRQTHNAHEMMITGLDEQFKNMSTMELANIIMDNLKRLPTALVPLDIQNFHERLVDLEMFRQEYIRRSKLFAEDWGEDLQRIMAAKRSLAEDDDGLEQHEKRQRVEGLRV